MIRSLDLSTAHIFGELRAHIVETTFTPSLQSEQAFSFNFTSTSHHSLENKMPLTVSHHATLPEADEDLDMASWASTAARQPVIVDRHTSSGATLRTNPTASRQTDAPVVRVQVKSAETVVKELSSPVNVWFSGWVFTIFFLMDWFQNIAYASQHPWWAIWNSAFEGAIAVLLGHLATACVPQLLMWLMPVFLLPCLIINVASSQASLMYLRDLSRNVTTAFA